MNINALLPVEEGDEDEDERSRNSILVENQDAQNYIDAGPDKGKKEVSMSINNFDDLSDPAITGEFDSKSR